MLYNLLLGIQNYTTFLIVYSKQIFQCSFLPLSSLPADQIRVKSSFAQQFRVSSSLKKKRVLNEINNYIYNNNYITQTIKTEASNISI